MAITVAPLTTTVMNSVGEDEAGTASGINNAVSRTGSLLAIAVLSIVLVDVFSPILERGLSALNLPAGVRQAITGQSIKLAGIEIPPGVSPKVHAAIQQTIDEAYISGFRTVMLICAGLALVSAVISWVMIGGKAARRAGNAAGTGQHS